MRAVVYAYSPFLVFSQVNSSPALSRDNDLDYEIKDALILDTLALVDPPTVDWRQLRTILQRRLTEKVRGRRDPTKQKRELNSDLNKILGGVRPRLYGEDPARSGKYQRIAPSKEWDQIQKVGCVDISATCAT